MFPIFDKVAKNGEKSAKNAASSKHESMEDIENVKIQLCSPDSPPIGYKPKRTVKVILIF